MLYMRRVTGVLSILLTYLSRSHAQYAVLPTLFSGGLGGAATLGLKISVYEQPTAMAIIPHQHQQNLLEIVKHICASLFIAGALTFRYAPTPRSLSSQVHTTQSVANVRFV